MNTTLLRYAVEYAACGSAQKTAERLGVNRSSVTRNIKRLEEELGAQLFITTGDGPVPTNFGEICLRHAREILKEEENLRFDFAGDGVYSGTIDIGMGSSRSQQVLPSVLPEFHRRYPNISIQLHEMSTADLSIGLLNQRLDFAVVSQPALGRGIAFEPLMTERLVLVAPREDAFARLYCYQKDGGRYIRLEQFRDKRFILGYPAQKSRAVCDRVFRRVGFEPQVIFQTRNNYTAAMLASNGLAYALVPESCTRTGQGFIEHYQMDPELEASWTIGIATLSGKSLSHAAEQLKRLMLKALGDQTAGNAE